MSHSSDDAMQALERAAREADDGAFDTAFGELLVRARSAANPAPPLRELVASRVHGELAAAQHLTESARSEGPELAAAALGRGGGASVQPVRARAWGGTARGFALLSAGIAIGFVLGRTPAEWPNGRAAAPDSREAPVSRSGSPEAASVADVMPPAPAVAAPSGAVPMAGLEAPASSTAAAPGSRPQAGPSRAQRGPERALPDAGSLRFALEQLRKAQLFLRAHEPARALGALDTLDARVPASVLQEEREVTRTLAWCDSGQVAKARALAQRLIQRAPDSAYATSLRESCAGADSHDTPDLLQQMRERTSNPPR